MSYESLAIEDHFAGLLTTLGEAVQGTVVGRLRGHRRPRDVDGPQSGDLVVQLATLVAQALDHDGPWGLRHLGAADEAACEETGSERTWRPAP